MSTLERRGDVQITPVPTNSSHLNQTQFIKAFIYLYQCYLHLHNSKNLWGTIISPPVEL